MPEDKLTPHHETHHHGHDDLGHHGEGKLYETSDINLSAIVKSLFFLAGFLVFAAIAGGIILKFFVPDVGNQAVPQSETRVRQQLPGPRLQANPVQEIKDYRTVEQGQLSSYGRDPRTGALHIPIDVAIEKVVTDLPVRPGATEVDIKTTTSPNTPVLMQDQVGSNNSSSQNANKPQAGNEPAPNGAQNP